MYKNNSISLKQLHFLVLSAMIFSLCEVLSIELNDYFTKINISRFIFEFNISVVFFCISFFILDLVVEIFDNKIADYFIYSKIISQLVLIIFGRFSIAAGFIPPGQFADSFTMAPYLLLDSIVASFIGYKLTGRIMQYLKIKFEGKFLFSRYLSSTLPGEIVFSIVFSLLAFSKNRGIGELIQVICDLIIVKFALSFFFSLLIVPITNLTRYYLSENNRKKEVESVPFN